MTSEVVMVSGGILKSGSIIRKCKTEEKSSKYIKGENYQKVLLDRGIFRENTVKRSRAFWRKKKKIWYLVNPIARKIYEPLALFGCIGEQT